MVKRTLLNRVGCTLLLLAATILNSQAQEETESLESKIDHFFSNGVAEGFSGAILVAKKGEVIINKGYGMANRVQNIPISPNTVFDIGSVTKQFTASAVLKLVQSGDLKVTDPLSRFFGNIPTDKRDITVHQLLTHSAGLTDTIGHDFDHISRELFFSNLFATALIYEPGKKYSYSNAGYSVLARIIELISGQEYEVFLSEHLFKPAGMENTGYLIPDWNDDSFARGYARGVFDRGSMITRYQEDLKVSWHLKGNGGINSTHEDMYRWYRALKENRTLTTSSFENMTAPHIARANGSGYLHYGYGWGIAYSDGRTKKIAHNGANGLFSHSFIWSQENDTVVIYSTNNGSLQVERLAHDVDKMISDDSYQAVPIKMDVYRFIIDFTKTNFPRESNQLLALIKSEYISDFRNSNVLNRIGYEILEAESNLEWAVELFKLNVQLFESEGNLWDSLGDGYLAINQTEKAIKSFEKAVALGSEETIAKLRELLQGE